MYIDDTETTICLHQQSHLHDLRYIQSVHGTLYMSKCQKDLTFRLAI